MAGQGQFGSAIDASIWAAVQAAFPNATLNSAYRPGDSGFHGKGQACDIGGPLQEVANWAVRQDLAQVIYGPGPLLYNVNGTNITDQAQLRNQVYAGDIPAHYDHVHLAAEHVITGGAVSPGDSAVNSILGASNPITAGADVLKAAAKLTDALTDKSTWIRIMKLVGGAVAVLLGLYYMLNSQIAGVALKALGVNPEKAVSAVGGKA